MNVSSRQGASAITVRATGWHDPVAVALRTFSICMQKEIDCA
jgi:hypothetical protein